jgi:callose synthase
VKLAFANIWNIILPVCYANSRRKYCCLSKKKRRKYCYYNKYGSLIQEWCFTSYMVAAAIYLTSNAAEVVLFFVPAIRKYIEVSNNKICKVLAWWIQVSSS